VASMSVAPKQRQPCNTPGCGKPARARGMCTACYGTARRKGDLITRAATLQAEQRAERGEKALLPEQRSHKPGQPVRPRLEVQPFRIPDSHRLWRGACDPQKFSQLIHELTGDTFEIAAFFISVMRDELPGHVDLDVKHRITAATWLADRALGKMPETLRLAAAGEAAPAQDISRLSKPELAEYLRLRRKMQLEAEQPEALEKDVTPT